VAVLLAGRRSGSSTRPQPFDVAQADKPTFTLTRTGERVQQSITWGFAETIPLTSIGNNMLAGWGGSIGNNGPPSYWVVAVSERSYGIPG
jgi:hypothetical protein